MPNSNLLVEFIVPVVSDKRFVASVESRKTQYSSIVSSLRLTGFNMHTKLWTWGDPQI